MTTLAASTQGPLTWIDAGPFRLRVQDQYDEQGRSLGSRISLLAHGRLIADREAVADLPAAPVTDRLRAAARALLDIPRMEHAGLPGLPDHIQWLAEGGPEALDEVMEALKPPPGVER